MRNIIKGMQPRDFIIDSLPDHSKDIVSYTAKEFGLTRQAINRHINILIQEGLVEGEGHTNTRSYKLAITRQYSNSFVLKGLADDDLWQNNIGKLLANLPENVNVIWQIGFTEIVSNAIDHSDGNTLNITLQKTAATTDMFIKDDGIGIFRKIRNALGLEDERYAVLELAKGKLTTSPGNHSGEGIFFTSRMFDHFHIFSGGVFYSHDPDEDEDWILEPDKPAQGTMVYMSIKNNSKRTDKEIYNKFASSKNDFSFSRTVVPVRLLKQGPEQLVSRSQGKRLLARFDRFKTVILDFKDINEIGQAFADEVFRVFQTSHPEVKLVSIHATPQIRSFIKRSKTGGLPFPLPSETKVP
jgi:anti-sigma regulatory factor (Ser/Thr protein kinase)